MGKCQLTLTNLVAFSAEQKTTLITIERRGNK